MDDPGDFEAQELNVADRDRLNRQVVASVVEADRLANGNRSARSLERRLLEAIEEQRRAFIQERL